MATARFGSHVIGDFSDKGTLAGLCLVNSKKRLGSGVTSFGPLE
jgi:hypothetical protein